MTTNQNGHIEASAINGTNPSPNGTSDTHAAEMGTGLSKESSESLGALRGTILGVCLGSLIFMQASNISMLTTVSSSIASDLDAYDSVSWLTSSYLIAMSSLTPVGGRLCIIFSSPSCMLLASVLFSIGAVICAVSPTLPWFLFGRVVGGCGAAFIYGVATVLVIQLVSKKRRGLFVGLVNSGYTVGVASGAVIAGALDSAIGWRSIFWLSVPFAIPAGLGIFFFAPRSRADRLNADQTFLNGLKRIDYLGVITLTSSVVLLLYSFSGKTIVWPTFGAAFPALALFFLVEARYAREPVIPIEVFKSRGVVLTCLSTLAYMMSRWSVLFYTPIYSIAVRQWSPATAGLILIPTNGGFAIGGLLVGLIHIRKSRSYYVPTLIAYVLFSCTMFVFSRISIAHPVPGLYVVVAFINGFITGATLNYSYQHLLHVSKPKTHAIVTSMIAMFRGFAGSFGSAIGGGIFSRVLQSNLEMGFEGQDFEGKDQLIRRLIGSPLLARSLHGEQREVARDAYVAATQALFLAASGLGLIAVVLQSGTGWKAAEEEDIEDDEVRPLLQNEE